MKPVNGNTIDWTAYTDEDIQRFIRELEAEQNRRRAKNAKHSKPKFRTW